VFWFLFIVAMLTTGRTILKDREQSALNIDQACWVLFLILLIEGWAGMIMNSRLGRIC
ncbi:MAG: hypothetical protein GDA36_01885, partial [Rhodobacteraceae bacterium]|nr:hypothetical protein [Paracoccaceae bacterium]